MLYIKLLLATIAFIIMSIALTEIFEHLHIPITLTDIYFTLMSVLGILLWSKIKKWKLADNIGVSLSIFRLIGTTIINILCLVFGVTCAYFGCTHPLLLLKGESIKGGPVHGYSMAFFGIVIVLLIVTLIYFSISNRWKAKKL